MHALCAAGGRPWAPALVRRRLSLAGRPAVPGEISRIGTRGRGSTSYRPMRRRRRASCRAPCPTCRASSRPKLLYVRYSDRLPCEPLSSLAAGGEPYVCFSVAINCLCYIYTPCIRTHLISCLNSEMPACQLCIAWRFSFTLLVVDFKVWLLMSSTRSY